MSNAVAGPGFLLQVGTQANNNGAFTTVAEVKDIVGPAVSVDVIDVTNQDSPGGYEEIIPTIRRPGEVDFDVHFNPASGTHDGITGLLYLANNKVKRGWRILLNDPGNHYWHFLGFVTGFQTKAPVAGVLTATTKIKITGQPVIGTLPS
jgi:predicted secreted protein